MFRDAQLVEAAKNLFRQFMKFGAIGVMNTLLYSALYLIFLTIIAPAIAYYSAYLLSMIFAILMNLKFTFQKQATVRKIVLFACVYLFSMYIGGLVLAVLIGFSISAQIAGLLIVGVNVVINFSGLKAVAKWA